MIGTSQPKRPRVWILPIRLCNLLWIPAIGAILWGITEHGTPHMLFKYTYRDSFVRAEGRIYTSCDYVGLHSQRLTPGDFKCPLFQFLKDPQGSWP